MSRRTAHKGNRTRSRSTEPRWWWCRTCEKRTYARRKDAEKIVRRMHDAHRDSFRCDVENGFHIGRKARAVMQGVYTRDEWRQNRAEWHNHAA